MEKIKKVENAGNRITLERGAFREQKIKPTKNVGLLKLLKIIKYNLTDNLCERLIV